MFNNHILSLYHAYLINQEKRLTEFLFKEEYLRAWILCFWRMKTKRRWGRTITELKFLTLWGPFLAHFFFLLEWSLSSYFLNLLSFSGLVEAYILMNYLPVFQETFVPFLVLPNSIFHFDWLSPTNPTFRLNTLLKIWILDLCVPNIRTVLNT